MINTKTSLCWLLAMGLICQQAVQAQTNLLGPYPSGTASPQVEVDSNGLFYTTGAFGTGTLPSALYNSGSATNTWMYWYPGKASFRVGSVDGPDWNDTNVGYYSYAFGFDLTVSGHYSFANGYENSVTSWYSAAFGRFNNVNGGGDSLAWGNTTSATGWRSTAFGYLTYATNYDATAFGIDTMATAYESTALGDYTIALSDCEVAMGKYNVGLSETGGTPSLTNWVSTDPVLEIGNGTSSSSKADALVVYKGGDVQAHGKIRCNPGGDLSMGNFTAGTAP